MKAVRELLWEKLFLFNSFSSIASDYWTPSKSDGTLKQLKRKNPAYPLFFPPPPLPWGPRLCCVGYRRFWLRVKLLPSPDFMQESTKKNLLKPSSLDFPQTSVRRSVSKLELLSPNLESVLMRHIIRENNAIAWYDMWWPAGIEKKKDNLKTIVWPIVVHGWLGTYYIKQKIRFIYI